jgi:CrcB protein
MTAVAWIGVALAGGAGAVARIGLGAAIERRHASDFPLATLCVNGLGALALGLVVGLGLAGTALVLAAAGLIGSFTTFSTWLFETHRLTEVGQTRLAALNVALSLAVGLTALGAGWAVGAAVGG